MATASNIKELFDYDYDHLFFKKLKNLLSWGTANAGKVKLRVESNDIPEKLENEITSNANFIGFLTDEKKLKVVPLSKYNMIMSEDFYPYFEEKNMELQSGKILSVSFRNAANKSTCSLACLYDTNKLCVYKVANEKYLIKDDSVDISNIKFFRWSHLPEHQIILIVHGSQSENLTIWDLSQKSMISYLSTGKILDVAWFNQTEKNKLKLIAFSSDDKKITIINSKCELQTQLSESANQKVIFLENDNIFICGRRGEYQFGYKAIHLNYYVGIFLNLKFISFKRSYL